jgi:hypothetical protein
MAERNEQKQFIIETKKRIDNNRNIANLTNEKFNTDYWDSERVRDVIRKKNKKETRQYVNDLIKNEIESSTISCGKGVLDLADLHIPFQIDGILDIIKKHKHEINAIVFSGDLLDCFEISKFISIESHPIENELINAIDFLHQVRELVGDDIKIILIYGNHCYRWKRYIASMQQKKLYKFLNPNVLEMLKTGFTLYENGETQAYEGIKDLTVLNSWYVNIENELIICHPNNYSKADVRNAKMAIEYFITEGEEFSAVAVSHTHHMNQTFDYLGRRGFEVGCLCKPFDYSNGYTSKRKNINGYALFFFDKNNKIDINKTKLIEIKTENNKNNENLINL